MVKDEDQGVAGLGGDIAAQSRHLSGHAARIFGDHFAETVALDSQHLSGFDLVIELDEMFDEPGLSRQNGECAVADKDTRILRGCVPWARGGCHET